MRRFERSEKMTKLISLMILPSLINMVLLTAYSSALETISYSPYMDDSNSNLSIVEYQSSEKLSYNIEKSSQTELSSNDKIFFTQKPEDYPEKAVEDFFKSKIFSEIYKLFFEEVKPDISLRFGGDSKSDTTLCKTDIYHRPWKSENDQNEIVDIIQGNKWGQYFIMEVCSGDKDVKHSCNEVSNHKCVQGYAFTKMLAISTTTGEPYIETVIIPSFCMCMKNITTENNEEKK